MIEVFQTRFAEPDGNCWEACLASILEVPLGAIPDGREHGMGRMRWGETARWLWSSHRLALAPLWLHSYTAGSDWPIFREHSILSGRRVCGSLHSVVVLGDTVVHDPLPQRLRAPFQSAILLERLLPGGVSVKSLPVEPIA